MINKPLHELAKERATYEQEMAEALSDEAKAEIHKKYINGLRLYLYETKMAIKEIFRSELSPFKTQGHGYDALLRRNDSTPIVKKTKAEFFGEIDRLGKDNSIYLSLNDEQKAKIDTAFYILKTYYENELR